MKSSDVAAYTYKADVYHPGCAVLEVLKTDGLEGHGLSSDNEDALDLLARFRGIDRMDETSFDSDDFPKVVFFDQVSDLTRESDRDYCGRCHGALSGYAYITRSWMRATVRTPA